MVCSKPSKRYWIRHSLGYSAQINGTDNQRKEAQQQKGTTTHSLENSMCCTPHLLTKTDNLTALVEFPMHYIQINDFQLFPPIYFYYYYCCYYYSNNGGFGQALESKNY